MSCKGRTIFDILTGRNKPDARPVELRFYNPLGAKIGNTISFQDEPEIDGVNFVLEKINVYKTIVSRVEYHHTDYHLKGITLDMDKPIRFRLRLIEDEGAINSLGCRVQFLSVVDEMAWDEEFYENVLCSQSGDINIHKNDLGEDLPEPFTYWRIDDFLDAYKSEITSIKDTDKNGLIQLEDIVRNSCYYWDYHRDTINEFGVKFREYLTIEMDEQSQNFTFLRGREADVSQIIVF